MWLGLGVGDVAVGVGVGLVVWDGLLVGDGLVDEADGVRGAAPAGVLAHGSSTMPADIKKTPAAAQMLPPKSRRPAGERMVC